MENFNSDPINEISLVSPHDSWVKISDYFHGGMWHFFADGWVPSRDPFPMGGWSQKKEQLWALDMKRMTVEQINGMIYISALEDGVSKTQALLNAVSRGGVFRVHHRIIESVRCGKEGLERLGELLDFINLYPDQYPPAEDWNEFVAKHEKVWIGDRKKPKEIRDIEDIHPCIISNGVPQFKTTRGLIEQDEIVFEISNFQWS